MPCCLAQPVALGYAVATAYEPAYGARPLRRWLEHKVRASAGVCACRSHGVLGVSSPAHVPQSV
jgi:hypothetical protein